MSDLLDVYERMVASWTSLQEGWSDTRRNWRDAVGDRFTREFWSEWESTIPDAMEALRDLGDVLDQASKAVDQE